MFPIALFAATLLTFTTSLCQTDQDLYELAYYNNPQCGGDQGLGGTLQPSQPDYYHALPYDIQGFW